MAAYMEARSRALTHASVVVRLMGARDHLHADVNLLERELEVFRCMRQRIPAKQRPHYSPEARGMILQLMALRSWSTKTVAQRFVVHPNTIRKWLSDLDDDVNGPSRIGSPPWNRIHESVRWLVHEMRRLCPEPEFGTRTIARHIVRAGIQISRSSVQRVLQEHASRPKRPEAKLRTKAPPSIQHPTEPHQVWHLDLTELRVLWLKVEIAVVIDGFTRKIISLQAFDRRATTDDMIAMVTEAIEQGSCPRFLVTDHGSQFRPRFREAVEAHGLVHVRCSVGQWQLNAKVERVIRSIKSWAARAMLVPSLRRIQIRLDAFGEWHNHRKPHAAHGMLTPAEVEAEAELPQPVKYDRTREIEPKIEVRRMSVQGDPSLVYPLIRVRERPRSAA